MNDIFPPDRRWSFEIRVFPGTRVPITRAVLVRWAMWSTALSVAQLFRTPIEQIVASGFGAAAICLGVAAVNGRAVTAYVGFAIIAVAALARAASAPWLPTDWHGAVIIVTAWTMYAYLAAERAASSYRIIRQADQ